MLEPTFEFFDLLDDLPERSLAVRAASTVGVPVEVLEALRSVEHGSRRLSAVEWLELALDFNRGWRRAA